MDYKKSPGGIWQPCADLQPIGIQSPAAGANLSYTLRPGGIYRLLSLLFTFTTSADVATRVVGITLSHGGLTFFRAKNSQSHTASLAFFYCAFPGTTPTAVFGNTGHIAFPAPSFVPGETIIATTIESIQAGDQISAVALYVEFFPGAGEY